jgi:hemoglobin-like flavoprotein
MTPTQLAAIKSSWALAVPHADAVGNAFYANLFTIDATLRPLFADDISGQSGKFMAMVTRLVNHLDDAETVSRELTGLAQRHTHYGVRPGHYTTAGQALVQTLSDGLGDHWTPPVQEAWSALYQTIASAMIAIGEAEQPEQAMN